MNKPIYNKREWVLGMDAAKHLNYVEPHGTTAHCPKCGREVEHENIPYELRDASGTRLIRKP